jgi:hypothetical protein
MIKILLLFLITSFCFSQNNDIVGLSRIGNLGQGGEVYLSSINPSNGLIQDIANTSYSEVALTTGYTVNPVLDIYYYASQDAFIGIDINNGSLVSSPVISGSSNSPSTFSNFLYNELTQNIIGLELFGLNNGIYLSEIDPITGMVTKISTSSIANVVNVGGGQALDLSNQWYHFISNDRIMTIDISTGALLHNPLIDTSKSQFFDNIIYNESDGNIYGLARNSSPLEIFLGRIDPITGNVTVISGNSLGQYFNVSGAAIDPFSNIYYFQTDQSFVSVDISTGNVINSPFFDSSQTNGGNFGLFYYANERISLLDNQGFSLKSEFDFYPNPSNNVIFVEGDKIEKVEIIDIFGRVQVISNSANSSIDVSHLADGTYFVKAFYNNSVSVKKLLKT